MTGQPATTAAIEEEEGVGGEEGWWARGQEATTANDGQVFVATVQ